MMLQNHPYIKYLFKMQERLIDYNETENKKFIIWFMHMQLLRNYQLLNLGVVMKKNIHNYLKSLLNRLLHFLAAYLCEAGYPPNNSNKKSLSKYNGCRNRYKNPAVFYLARY